MDRKQYLDALESSLVNLLKKAIINVIVQRLPFLGLAAFNPVLTFVVGKLVDLGVKEAKLRVFFVYCDLRCDYQASTFEQAALEYDKNKTPENEKIMLDKFYKLASFKSI